MTPQAEQFDASNDRSDELDWQAFRYVSDEMSVGEAAAFESRLADDQRAREAVAAAVELMACVASGAARSVAPVAATESGSTLPPTAPVQLAKRAPGAADCASVRRPSACRRKSRWMTRPMRMPAAAAPAFWLAAGVAACAMVALAWPIVTRTFLHGGDSTETAGGSQAVERDMSAPGLLAQIWADLQWKSGDDVASRDESGDNESGERAAHGRDVVDDDLVGSTGGSRAASIAGLANPEVIGDEDEIVAPEWMLVALAERPDRRDQSTPGDGDDRDRAQPEGSSEPHLDSEGS